jgi:RimJ/RimL family protein N-acetyltransferase
MLHDKTESHVGTFGLSIDASVRGKGLGEALMRAVLDEAVKLPGIRIIELKVKAPNAVARALYEKLGFIEYGLLPLGTQHQGAFVDEVMMYKNV